MNSLCRAFALPRFRFAPRAFALCLALLMALVQCPTTRANWVVSYESSGHDTSSNQSTPRVWSSNATGGYAGSSSCTSSNNGNTQASSVGSVTAVLTWRPTPLQGGQYDSLPSSVTTYESSGAWARGSGQRQTYSPTPGSLVTPAPSLNSRPTSLPTMGWAAPRPKARQTAPAIIAAALPPLPKAARARGNAPFNWRRA